MKKVSQFKEVSTADWLSAISNGSARITVANLRAQMLPQWDTQAAAIDGLDAALAGKANTGHTHAISEVTGLQSALDARSTKRREAYSGTSNASGLVNIVFSPAFAAAPSVQANVIGQGTEVQSRIVSVSATGCQIHVFQRVAVLTLALSTATTHVSGAGVDVQVMER